MDNDMPITTKVPNRIAIFSFRYPVLSNVVCFVLGVVVGAIGLTFIN